VPLVRRVEIQCDYDLAGVDEPGQLLPDVPRRVELVDFRHLALWLRWLNRGDLGDLRKQRAVLRPIKLGPQPCGFSQFDPSYHLFVNHDDIDMVMGLPRLILVVWENRTYLTIDHMQRSGHHTGET